jgi:hypothetical protein
MTKQHKATPDDWAQQEDWVKRSVYSDSSCIIELRDRVEALEAAKQPPLFTAEEVALIVAPTVKESLTDPAGSLVERVQAVCDDTALGHEARAAILEVAAWMSKHPFGKNWAMRLEREANNG